MSSLSELNSTPAFACSRCDLCYQRLNINPLYEALDRGDGVCMHYDSTTRHTANLQACQQLIDRFGTDQRISIINNRP